MFASPHTLTAGSKCIQLPRSSTRFDRPYAHLKLLTRVRPGPWGASFEGKILAPGALLADRDLGPHPVVLECVGPQGPGRPGRQREMLWILWRYDRVREEWVELARAQAVASEWTLALKGPALRALNPQPPLIDVLGQARHLADEIMERIDETLLPEGEDLQTMALATVYDQLAGRIAAHL